MGETPIKGRIYNKGLGHKDQVAGVLADDFHSGLVEALKTRGYSLEAPGLTLLLAREFGFCYGVDRALGYAYETCRRFPDRRIFITGDVIHNPRVNERLRSLGVKYLPQKDEDPDRLEGIGPGDVVLLPAFGAEREDVDRLEELGCTIVDTTCGSVLLVWKSVEKYARDGYTAVIHGKHYHAETRAACSQILKIPGGRYLVLLDLNEARIAAEMIRDRLNPREFLGTFHQQISPGFDPLRDMEKIGLANQTTMLSSESLAVGGILREAMADRYGMDKLGEHYRSFETICSATQDRQDAVEELLKQKLDLLIVIGGHNSSNTGHLAEISHRTVPTYHVEGARDLLGADAIRHLPVGAAETVITKNWLPGRDLRVGLTAGASTPDRQVGRVIELILKFKGLSCEDYLKPSGG
ncbi:MAG: 4-hydroxy-3-methylbut-2-enyl diphosphate reductase [Candidatus Eisenbacteria bacterium]|uniref:4-hydroxy-3-methylbut-2-enyl diphosphate reductase n=1 Tax=Eiseniibacteriota bacterium TaxID=2212470 RepID=A0A948S310_UNCEI|nr:4-hydroxy-3-methylbut-2-enyl diphosphate reductase [Candidatus Eisenbacteria bacterium]MBU1950879.1 4-hydroxy-3-methylbut-2-enyl diphosphate reductase [Candidatus Eisenbacteria bacterium]MBU2692869.1 4-hydroxy-3-methylbut-2-enyl diphosphate reductase [Candidatus Eisenbacteria bacterium]